MTTSRFARALVFFFLVGLVLSPLAMAHAVTRVTEAAWIVDEPRYLQTESVAEAINAMDWPTGAQVAVLVSNDPSLTPESFDADVKDYVGEALPAELVGPEGLAPSTVLVAISPTARRMGVYAHSNMDLNSSTVESAVNAMRSPAKAGDWQAAIIAGANEASTGLASGPPTPTDWSTVLKNGAIFVGIIVAILTSILAVMVFLHSRNEKREAAAKAAREEEQARRKAADRARQAEVDARRREKLLAWPGVPKADLELALSRWRDLATRDATYALRGDLSPSDNIKRIEKLLAANAVPSDEQKLDKKWRARLEGSLSSYGQAHQELDFEHSEGRFVQVWENRSASLLGSTLRDAEDGLEKVREHLSEGDLDRADTAIASFQARTNDVDRRVRDKDLSGPDGLEELRREIEVLKSFFRDFAREAETVSAPSRKRRAAANSRSYSSSNADAFNLSALMWVAVASSSSSSSRSSSSNTYSDSSSNSTFTSFTGGGFDGGSGGF